jgi:hypothetical protein
MKKIGFITILLFVAFSLQAQTGTITGTVTNQADDEVWAGATVILGRMMDGPGGGYIAIDTATTNAWGVYTFTDVPAAANYLIDVTADGFAPARSWGIDLQSNQIVTVNVQMQEVSTATITGTVTNQTNDEVIVGATVVLGQRTGGGGGATYTPIDTTTTNAAGEYTFADIPGLDNYYVEVSADGFVTDIDDNVDLLDLPPDATEWVNFQLQEMQTATITGTVTNQANDEVIVGAMVVLGQRFGGAGGAIFTPMGTTTTNAAGEYTFDDIDGINNYYVEVSADGFVTEMDFDVDLADLPPNATETVDFALALLDLIVYGCTDPNYLEYNPDANFHVQDSCHNPFINSLTITFPNSTASKSLSIYNITGTQVKQFSTTGNIVTWNVQESGVYYIRALVDGKNVIRRVVL